jgi:putative molybdopterin biosynthesis protein
MGEDMVATELVLPANRPLTPVDIGAITGCGHTSVAVRRKPTVAIIPTGTEIVTAEQAVRDGVQPGDIIEYNSLMLAGQVREWGGDPFRLPVVPDDFEEIKRTVTSAAAGHDLVLIIAGSSAGSEDYTAPVIESLGEVLVHGVAVRPGHPVVLGMLDTGINGPSADKRAVPVIGVPGYPVSCALTGELFVAPLLSRWLGYSVLKKPTLEAHITRKVHSAAGTEEFLRVTVGKVGRSTVAAPLSRGAGIIMSLVRADGIVRIPRLSEGLDSGDSVTVELYRDPSEIEKTIVHIGSHDLCLDLLAQFLAEKEHRLTSTNAGSLGGLVSLRRGEAHLAGSHLLDPESGDYNVSYVRKYLPETEVVLITFVHREQGFIIPRGNPKNIKGFEDLSREDIQVVNRQRGAGTRLLLDYHLEHLGISPESVPGYSREEYTHLAVAAAVSSGTADCGLGISAAAQALDLDFIPVAQERYELVIPRVFYETKLLNPLLESINSSRFKAEIEKLSGYDASHTGEVRSIYNQSRKGSTGQT